MSGEVTRRRQDNNDQ